MNFPEGTEALKWLLKRRDELKGPLECNENALSMMRCELKQADDRLVNVDYRGTGHSMAIKLSELINLTEETAKKQSSEIESILSILHELNDRALELAKEPNIEMSE